MDQSGNALLLRFIESQQFGLFTCIAYLTRYASNIGIHHHLCQKLRTYKIEDLSFFIPQLCQILVTVETESMALEDLLLDMSTQHPHFTLLTFWYLQAHLTDLSDDPNSHSFQSARRLLNNLQYILFNIGSPPSKKVRENVAPSVVLTSAIAASMGLPQLGQFIGPVAQSQGRKQKSFVFELVKNFKNKLTDNLTMKNTLTNSSRVSSSGGVAYDTIRKSSIDESYKKEQPSEKRKEELNYDFASIDSYTENVVAKDKRHKLTKELLRTNSAFYEQGNDLSTASSPTFGNNFDNSHNSASMPELQRSNTGPSSPQGSIASTPDKFSKRGRQSSRGSHHGANIRNISPALMTTPAKIKLLKSNYFRCETQFAIALQSISVRLSQVPQEARLSSLRAELSLLNRDLPAEVDIPTLLPPNRRGKLHKIVHITANEAAVLNSAERVPFLLLIEYLSDELDFDPSTNENDKLLHEKPNNSYIFDLGIQTSSAQVSPPPTTYYDEKPKETDLGDLSVVKLSNKNGNETFQNDMLVASATNIPIINQEEERASDLNFQSNYHFNVSDNVDTSDLATQMRIAAVMLSQLDGATSTLPVDQSTAIKARIISSMQSLQDHFGYKDLEAIHGAAGERKLENDLKLGGVSAKNSKAYLGEDWQTKKERIRKNSMYGHLDNWELCSVIAKTGDDLRQEAFASQVIQAMASIWKNSNCPVWVKRMRILITSANTGLVETITNALSVHSIKKALTKLSIEDGENVKGTISTLTEHFERSFGDPKSAKYKRAQEAFASSLAAYSVICYLLQIKDRHNGNIMLDNEGHIIHIDFGFLLSNSPGSVGFEAAPFKLTLEYVELLGGLEGAAFQKFKELTKDSFKALRKNADYLITMVELMQKESNLPCFKAGPQTSVQFKQRFQLHLSETECDAFVENYLIGKSIGSIYTRLYDQFQLLTQGIYS
ncbi:phosphatidylinositol 4-kinase [Wickerhamomyces ciferrii]|uniref:1-phosphatidylinositol 4-kinase n=1 Tax=Wickerhamomyces ciferrii (strain ATCC 14091 / BCRC 22168 / CBS 111 / JCM 3599 / NBRC 0793 / NRRL Y-1031 F-60-10) TaxID=1206466 RepID=K0KR64_WICCF|nr:phosphatidylinositol 4-kinase [Wickerhamomyces ciferrii]CCH43783.1 phosphatidylinositol 4-kinase [Wickerhamomyces ciferrii]